MQPGPPRRYRTVARSLRLFKAFLKEQSEPEVFYRELARDTIALIERHEPLDGRLVVDVGAGEPQFAEEFARRGARYLALDLDHGVLARLPTGSLIQARGEQIPLANGCADVVMSSNVIEHVRRPGVLADEMVRIAGPGGLVFLAYTAWASPWGGHETSPWHYLGGEYAARRYERINGRPPKNRFGRSMHATTVAGGLRWAKSQPDAWLVEAAPRYHPDWATGVIGVPGLRELAAWNLLLVLRRR